MAEEQMFTQRYLTVRIAPGEGGLHLHPDFACGEDPDTGCNCTEGCSKCSGDWTNCQATCKAPASFGAIFPDPQGQVDFVLDLESLRKVLEQAEELQRQGQWPRPQER